MSAPHAPHAYTLCPAVACARAQAKDKARKDYEKAAKVREPLSKKLAEDPAALDKMKAEVEELRQQLAALGTA